MIYSYVKTRDGKIETVASESTSKELERWHRKVIADLERWKRLNPTVSQPAPMPNIHPKRHKR